MQRKLRASVKPSVQIEPRCAKPTPPNCRSSADN
ncbi:hypothetical protein VDGD_20774 [Verticillium dahliae]|nr:hypothetical protein VDGD_20774 [Verticillium dahliae]